MKNLKKVLAFVLVVAMMASITISASALAAKDFTDYTEVQNKDAVAMLTELGVINGYPTGDFKPAGTVTRAEMAKMIYVILNAGSDSAPTPDAQRYTDVWDGMWCEGYVAFCDDLGIIAGYGDGKFGPSDTVTGTQAAKMLLVAMGYDPAKEGFTGTNWDYNVLKVASAAGLFEGFGASVSEGCTRDNAALLIYNALIADEVSYVGDTVVENGKTLLGEYFGVVAMTGVVIANEYANLFDTDPLRAGYTEIAFIGDQYIDDDQAIDPYIDSYSSIDGYDYDPASLIAGDTIADQYDEEAMGYGGSKVDAVDGWDEYESFIFSTATTLDQIGTTVTVFAKLKGNYEEYYVNKVAYDEYDLFSGKIVGNVVDKGGLVKTYDGKSYEEFDYKDLKAEGITFDSNTRYFVNYALAWSDDGYPLSYDTDALNNDGFFSDTNQIEYNAPGEITKIYDSDGDGVAEIVLKTRAFFAQAFYDKYLETWDFQVAADSEADADEDFDDDENGYVDYFEEVPADVVVSQNSFANKDYVLVQVVDGTFYVEEAATVEGECTKVSWGDEDWDYATIDGTKYIESGLYWANDAECLNPDTPFYWDISGDSTTTTSDGMEKGSDYYCYLDAMGNIVAYYCTDDTDTGTKSLVVGSYFYYSSLTPTYKLLLTPEGDDELYLLDVDQDKYGLPTTTLSDYDDITMTTRDFFFDNGEDDDSINPGGVLVNGAWVYAESYYTNYLDNHFYTMLSEQLSESTHPGYNDAYGFDAEYEYTAVSSSSITVGVTDVSSYYVYSDEIDGYILATEGVAVEGTTYYTREAVFPYGMGQMTALVDAYYTTDDDGEYESVSVTSLEDENWVKLDMDEVDNEQDYFLIDGSTSDYLYADKNTKFFVCQWVEQFNSSGTSLGYSVSVDSFTGVSSLDRIDDVENAYAIEGTKNRAGVANYVVLETNSSALPEADVLAEVLSVPNSSDVIVLTSEGEVLRLEDVDGDFSVGEIYVLVDGELLDADDYDITSIGSSGELNDDYDPIVDFSSVNQNRTVTLGDEDYTAITVSGDSGKDTYYYNGSAKFYGLYSYTKSSGYQYNVVVKIDDLHDYWGVIDTTEVSFVYEVQFIDGVAYKVITAFKAEIPDLTVGSKTYTSIEDLAGNLGSIVDDVTYTSTVAATSDTTDTTDSTTTDDTSTTSDTTA